MPPTKRTVERSPVYWILGFIAVVVGGTVAVEDRYAKAADVSNAKAELSRELAVQRSFTVDGFAKQRKSSLEDKIFELEIKRESKKINEVELKQYFRYKAELDDINRELRGRGQGR